ncbi:DNA primase [Planktomarina sp.]|nr:DNA primase [Planktomarina sp.]
MSLPPGFLDELRSRVSITQVVGRKVVWDTRKSNQGKGDMWAPCPFHQEKSASFHVDDRKGYYYCFGCHAKGDALGFIKETENASFMEAVEILAREAGMPMPTRDPLAQQKADRRTQLTDVMEQALQFFRLQLNTSAGADARGYLTGRGLTQEALDRFEIGFAPETWQGLWDHLSGKSVEEELILAVGLAKPSSKGKRPYDTFRNRIIFPIRDPQGRSIGFGGRAMDPNDNAKYLNSPETELFDKGRSLYNYGPAREATGKGEPLILAEGYMDVIALVEAGFGAAVAPLGTAISETQLQLMWRVSDEPIIALDGDTAGIRAAQRVMDLALPLLEAGKSLRFAVMPAGQDPDDLIRSGGPATMQQLLDTARPMVDLLWEREIYGKNFDSPERKAALDKILRKKLRLIKDPSIRGHYGQAVKDMRWELFRPKSQSRRFMPKGATVPIQPQATTRSSSLASSSEHSNVLRQSVILASLLKTPEALATVEGQLEELQFVKPQHRDIQRFLLQYSGPVEGVWDAAGQVFGMECLDVLLGLPHVQIAPSVRHCNDVELVISCLQQEFAQMFATAAHGREVAEAVQDLSDLDDEGLTWRLSESAKHVQRTTQGSQKDTTEYKTATNGLKVKLEEQKILDSLLEQISFSKPN